MPLKIKIYTKALSDIQISMLYYEQQQKGLGRRFEKQIRATFKKIKEFPLAASLAYGTVRYKAVSKFPYIVLYEFDDERIYVLRVFNTHLEPQ